MMRHQTTLQIANKRAAYSRGKMAVWTALALSSALCGNGLTQVAMAQSVLPVVSADGGATLLPTGSTLTVDLDSQSRVINWQSFNVGAPNTVNFRQNAAATSPADLFVVNRVVGAGGIIPLSQIDGKISTNGNRIAVWLVNPTGITFGPNSSFAGGSLVLSTLDIDPAAFLANGANNTGDFRANLGPANGAITIGATSGITPSGNLGFIAVAPQITSSANVTAANGIVSLIAARDATLNLSNGSPIAITINRGSNLGSVTVSAGTLTGKSVILAAATDTMAVGNLLQIDAGATLTATGVGGRVILAAGAGQNVASAESTPVATPSLSILGTARSADIAINGTLNAAAGTVFARATGAVNATTNISAGTVNVTGRSVAIADAVSTVGAVSIASRSGALTAGNLNAKTALSAVATNGNLILANAKSGGLMTLTGSSVTVPTAMSGSDLTVTAVGGSATLTSVMSGGTSTIKAAGGTATVTDLSSTGNVLVQGRAVTSTGTIQTTNGSINIAASANALTLATVNAQGAGSTLTLSKAGTTGELTATSAQANGNVLITGTNGIRLGNAGSTTGNTTVATDGDITGLALVATPNSLLDYGRANITASAGLINVDAERTAGGNIGSLKLGDISASGGTLEGKSIDVLTPSATLTSARALNGNLNLEATAADIRLDTANATNGDINLKAINSVTNRAGTGGVNITATGTAPDGGLADISVTATTQVARIGTVSAAKNINVTGGTSAIASGNVIAGTADTNAIYTVTADSVSLGSLANAPITQSSTGATTITARTGSVTAAGNGLTLTSSSGGAPGNLNVIAASGSIDLRNATLNGGTSGTTPSRTASVALNAGAGTAAFGSINALNTFVTAAGGISSSGTITSENGLTLNGANVTLNNLETISAGASISITANTMASVSGNVTSRGGLTIDAGSIVLGRTGATLTQAANGAVLLVARTGSVTNNAANLALRSNADQVGTEALTISAAAGALANPTPNILNLVGGSTTGRESAITLIAGNIAFTGADGASLAVGGTGSFTATDHITTTNGLTVNVPGAISARNITTLGTNANITLTSADVASVTGEVSATGNYSVSGAGVTLGGAASSITQQANGSVSITATGPSGISQGSGSLILKSNADATPAANTQSLSLTSAGGIALSNTDLVGGSVTGRESAVSFAANGGNATIRKVDGQAITGAASGNLTLRQDSQSASTLMLTAGNTLAANGNLTAAGNTTLLSTAGAINLQAVTTSVGGNISATAGTNISALGNLAASGSNTLKANGGNITAPIVSGTSVTAMASGNVMIDQANATTGATTLMAGGSVIGSSASGASVAATAANGSVELSSATSTAGGISLTAMGTPGNVRLDTANANGGTITLRAAQNVRGRNGMAVSALTATGATSDVMVTGTAGAVTLAGPIMAGRSVAVKAGTTATVTNTVTAGTASDSGNYTVEGANVMLGGGASTMQTATGNVAINALMGSVVAGTPALSLSAGTQATHTLSVSATNALAMLGSNLSSGGNSNLSAVGGGITINQVTTSAVGNINATAGTFVTATTKVDAAGSATVVANNGAIEVPDVFARGGTASLTARQAMGDVKVNNVTAITGASGEGDILITAQRHIQGTPGSAVVSLSATGVNANIDATATAGNATIGAITSATSSAVTATAGNAVVSGTVNTGTTYILTAGMAATQSGTVTSGTDTTVVAGTTATVTNLVTAGTASTPGNYKVTGADVALGGAGPTSQSATGNVMITANPGSVTQGAGLLTLSATGTTMVTANTNVALANSNLSSGGDMTLAATTGSIEVLSGAAGGMLTGTAGTSITAGDRLTAGGANVLTANNGSITAPLVRGATVTALATNGNVSVNTVTATAGKAMLTATGAAPGAGNILVDTVAATSSLTEPMIEGDITLSAANNIAGKANAAVTSLTATGVNASIEATATAGDVSIAGRPATETTAEIAAITSATSAAITATAGNVTISGAVITGTDTTVLAGTAASVTNTVTAGTATTLGNYKVTGADVALGGAGPTSQSATGNVMITANPGSVTQGAGLLTLSATGTTMVTANTNIALANSNLSSGGDTSLAATAGSIEVLSGAAGGMLTGTAGTSITAGTSLVATGANLLTANNGSITAPLVTGSSVTAIATNGNVSVNTVSATAGKAMLTATGVAPDAGNILVDTVSAVSGASGEGSSSREGDIALLAANNIGGKANAAVTSLSATGMGANIVATATAGDATIVAITSATSAAVTAGMNAIVSGPVNTGTTYNLAAGMAATQSGTVASGTDTTVIAGRTATVTNLVTAGRTGMMPTEGNYTVTGANVVLGGAAPPPTPTPAMIIQSATGDVSITATTGSVSQGAGLLALSAGPQGTPEPIDTLSVRAATNVTLANSNLSSGGDMMLRATNGSIDVLSGTTTGGGNIGATAGALINVGNTLNASGMLTGTAGTSITAGTSLVATGANVLTASNGSITAPLVRGATVTASATNGNVAISSTMAGAGLTATANTGNLVLGSVSNTSGLATLTATGSAPAAGNIRLDSLVNGNGAVLVTASSDVSGSALAAANTANQLPMFGRANIAANGAGNPVTVTANNGTVQLGTISAGAGTGTSAGNQIVINARAIDATSLSALNGGLATTATTGPLIIGIGSVRTDAMLTSSGAPGTTNITTFTAGGAINATSNGSLTAGTLDAGEDLNVAGSADVSITNANAGDDVDITATGVAAIGTALARGTGPDTRPAADMANVRVTAQSLNVGTATATTGLLALTGRNGNVVLGTGVAATTATLTNAANGGTMGDVVVDNSLTARNAVTITSIQRARVSNATSTTGSIIVTAETDVTGGAASPAANLTALAAGQTVTVNAKAGGAVLGSLQSAANLRVDAMNTADIGSASSVTGNIDVTANGIELRGATATAMAGRTITLTNRADGTLATRLGGISTSTSEADFALSDAELNRIATDNLIIESGSQNIFVSGITLNPNTGRQNIRIFGRGSSTITIDGRVAECASGPCTSAANTVTRNFQLGGGLDNGNTVTTANAATVLANSIVGLAGTSVAPRAAIDLPSFNVDLRARSTVFGLSDLIGAAPATASASDVANNIVAQANSPLFNIRNAYNTLNGQPVVLLRANTLTVRYSGFALFQNTSGPGLSSGVDLGPNAPNSAIGGANDPARLRLFSTGETPANSFGIFARINGRIGRSAALLPIQVLDIGTDGQLRITQVNSRLNGCVLGAPDKGCLTNDTPVPNLDLFDERQANLLTSDISVKLDFDPLTGANNESLFVDFGGGLVPSEEGVNCPPGTIGPCPAPGRSN
jgi:filamentous hemagglutinin family protein